jgi:EAL and modified HD-GYP domain-containing signal transduction protein
VLLLAEVSRTDVDIARIESLISSDPSLAYSLLRLVNSSSFGLNVRVESIRQAIVLLGLVQVRQLAVLLTMAKNSVATSEEIIVLASIRAHMAQQLAPEAIAPLAFTTGLLSVIDTVLGTPMDELVSGLPLPVEVKDALLAGKGPIGEVMDVVYAFERADVTAVEQMRPGQADRMREIYASSVAWAEEVRRELSRAD